MELQNRRLRRAVYLLELVLLEAVAVSDRNHHVLFGSDMVLVSRHSKDVALSQEDLLVIYSLTKEQFGVLSYLNVEDHSRLVLLSCLAGVLDQLLARVVAIVTEDSEAVHAILDHLVDELLVGLLVNRSQDTGVALFNF